MNIDFEDKRAVVTGAAHGIGRGIALAFAARGAEVYGLDLNGEGLKDTARLGPVTPVAVDVSNQAAVRAAIQGLPGDVQILVNCAGGVRGQVGRPLEEVMQEDWQAIFDANLAGTFFATQAAATGMKRGSWGRVVNISSGAGRGISLTGIQAYASAKAGQIGLTRQLAHELGPFGITVNCVAPGFVRSNPTTERQWDRMGEAGQAALLQGIAMRRLGTVEDIVAAVMFLASNYAGWITGETLGVDGGR